MQMIHTYKYLDFPGVVFSREVRNLQKVTICHDLHSLCTSCNMIEISRKLFFILYKNSHSEYFSGILTSYLSRFILLVCDTIAHLESPQRKAQKRQTIR